VLAFWQAIFVHLEGAKNQRQGGVHETKAAFSFVLKDGP
jgi:hypothetical protein